MKIQGYDIGTSVRWSEDDSNGFRTGIVRSRYYDPNIVEIDGEPIEINVIGESPSYLVETSDDQDTIVIAHTAVVRYEHEGQ